MTSAVPFATPAAIVPTPALETSLTLMRASRFAFSNHGSIEPNPRLNKYHGEAVGRLGQHLA